MFEAQESNGASVLADARRNELDPQRLDAWPRRLGRPHPAEVHIAERGLKCAPIVLNPAADGEPRVVVRLAGCEVEVKDPGRVGPSWVARVAESLARS